MSPNDQVLKSFLVSVGFQIDDNAFRRFTNGISRVDSKMMLLGKTVAAAAVATEAMVHLFSMSMEKLYYASKRTNASVGNIQALEYGMQQVGLSADTARNSLEAMASAVRMNPGLRGLLDGMLGRSTEGEDQAEVMLEMVKKLSKMPHMVGSQFAQMFGMDEQTFLMMKDKHEELLAKMRERKELAKRTGIDAERAAANAVKYMNTWRSILERVEVVVQKLSADLLPAFEKTASSLNAGLESLSKFAFDPKTIEDMKEVRDALFSIAKSVGDIADKIGLIDFGNSFAASVKEDMIAAMHFASGMLLLVQGKWAEAKEEFGKGAHKLSGSPTPLPGTTGARQSASGKMSEARPAGSKGIAAPALPFGGPGSPSTGLVEAGSAERYARNIAELQVAIRTQRGEAQQKILNEELARLQSPASAALMTQGGYTPTPSVLASAEGSAAAGGKSISITQNTDIHVNGSSDPATTARNVAGAQRQVGSEICRNLEGCVR